MDNTFPLRTGKSTTLIIKGELTDLNTYIDAERSNRNSAAKIKKTNTELCLWQIKGKIKPIESKVDIEFYWGIQNRRKDPDNIAFAKKYILDAIVRAGILKNDGQKQINSFRDYFHYTDEPQVIVDFWEVA